jgi:hypothetical protein
MLRIPHCLDSRFRDGREFVSLARRLRCTPQKHYFSVSGTRFCWRPSKPQGLVWLEGLGKLKKKKNSMASSGIEPAAIRLIA